MRDLDTSALTTRRAILTTLAGGAAAVVAGTIRTSPVAAANGFPVVAGVGNTQTAATGISNSTSGGTALDIQANGGGTALIVNMTGAGTGLAASSISGRAVNGFSSAGIGVRGESVSDTGVFGKSVGANAVMGDSASNNASGVYGQNTGSGYGTAGRALQGVGVFGDTSTGIGVLANAGSATGTALHVAGRVAFTTSGLTAFAVGATSVLISSSTPIAAGTHILCTLESNQAGLSIERLSKSTSTGTFRVYLSGAVAVGKRAKVAWFVMG